MYHIRRLYHRIMLWYYGWQKRRLIKRMREMGKEMGLPSLDQWNDEQVERGICMYRNYKNN